MQNPINREPRPLVIVGAGGHGLEVLWVTARIASEAHLDNWNVLGFVDDRQSMRGRLIEGLPVLGSAAEFIETYRDRPISFHCAVGNNLHRQKLAEQFEAAGFQAATLIDPLTVISPRATVAPGVYIAPRCYVGPGAKLGRHVLVNVASSIGHDSEMHEFSQACPGVRVSGHCIIERLAFLGSNAVIHPGKRVGENASVAAASYVVRNVASHSLVMGVPAVSIHRALPADASADTDPDTSAASEVVLPLT